jgi:hypothetical protein
VGALCGLRPTDHRIIRLGGRSSILLIEKLGFADCLPNRDAGAVFCPGSTSPIRAIDLDYRQNYPSADWLDCIFGVS